MKKLLNLLLVPFLAISLNANAGQGNDYPTDEIVRYVLDCMADNGGLNDEAFYYCTCRFDALAGQITFLDYKDGLTYERNRAMAGEKGGFFRDSKRGEEKYEKVKAAREKAGSQCLLVKTVTK